MMSVTANHPWPPVNLGRVILVMKNAANCVVGLGLLEQPEILENSVKIMMKVIAAE